MYINEKREEDNNNNNKKKRRKKLDVWKYDGKRYAIFIIHLMCTRHHTTY